MKILRDRKFLSGAAVWAVTTIAYSVFVMTGLSVAPIAEDGLISLLSVYVPVLVLAVFLLLYLTRYRDPVAWEEIYAVDKKTAKKEAWVSVVYLAVTQFVLGIVFDMGLHFPGTAEYTTGSHSPADVWIWAATYTVVYTILPVFWLWQRGFSLKKLFSSFRWMRDMWIIVAYWAFDFFGPILLGAADFLGGITASQYAQGIPLGVLVNTLGAGLPVLVMMHVVFIPRIAVLFDNKLTVILFGGLYYALFSFFDQGADYNTLQTALTSFTYIIMTQTLVGMGKAAFTIVTGNPFVHFITLHVLSARIPFDTRMYIDIFKLR